MSLQYISMVPSNSTVANSAHRIVAPPVQRAGGATPLLCAVLLAVSVACASHAEPSTDTVAMTSPAGAAAQSVAGSGPAAGGGGSVAAVSGGAGAAGGAASGKLSFANDVFPKVIRSKCGACHNDGPSFGGLAFFPGPETAYANLVGVRSGDKEEYLCAGSTLKRVEPGDPEKSLMYLKLTNPSCGRKMPPPAFGTTTPEQIELVRQWIADGALP